MHSAEFFHLFVFYKNMLKKQEIKYIINIRIILRMMFLLLS